MSLANTFAAWGVASSLAAQVSAILRKYGSDAHLYLPGIGVINGFTAGNYLDSAGATPATVDNPVGLVVDSGGINALQATTANKPILRLSGGKYSWQFDGTDYLSLGSAPWQVSDNHCVIVGFNKSNTGVIAPLATLSGAGATVRAPALQVNTSGFVQAVWYDGTTVQSISGSVSIYGANNVASAIKISTAAKLRLNAVQIGTTTVNINPVSTGGAIGAFVDGSNGNGSTIYAVIGIKGTVSDADLLVLEKFVGMLAGVSL